jgi:GTP-binding protein
MKIQSVEFLCSSPSLRDCPMSETPEFAFIGRSNVGKSSLINMLAGKKGLAKVSGTPGKTRVINHFEVTCRTHEAALLKWNLVDLPGYGYARLSKSERDRFEGMIRNYLLRRETLAITFLLIDSRLTPQKNDQEFIRWLGENELAFFLVFTKTDKGNQRDTEQTAAEWKTLLATEWQELPGIILTSSTQTRGREKILETIEQALKEIYLNSSSK